MTYPKSIAESATKAALLAYITQADAAYIALAKELEAARTALATRPATPVTERLIRVYTKGDGSAWAMRRLANGTVTHTQVKTLGEKWHIATGETITAPRKTGGSYTFKRVNANRWDVVEAA